MFSLPGLIPLVAKGYSKSWMVISGVLTEGQPNGE